LAVVVMWLFFGRGGFGVFGAAAFAFAANRGDGEQCKQRERSDEFEKSGSETSKHSSSRTNPSVVRRAGGRDCGWDGECCDDDVNKQQRIKAESYKAGDFVCEHSGERKHGKNNDSKDCEQRKERQGADNIEVSEPGVCRVCGGVVEQADCAFGTFNQFADKV